MNTQEIADTTLFHLTAALMCSLAHLPNVTTIPPATSMARTGDLVDVEVPGGARVEAVMRHQDEVTLDLTSMNSFSLPYYLSEVGRALAERIFLNAEKATDSHNGDVVLVSRVCGADPGIGAEVATAHYPPTGISLRVQSSQSGARLEFDVLYGFAEIGGAK